MKIATPVLAFCILLLSGCGSIPPEASRFTGHLGDYHKSTTAGTLAAYDAVAQGLDFTIGKVRETNDQDWDYYIKEVGEAAGRMRRNADEAQQIEFLLSLVKEPKNTNDATILKAVRERLKALQAANATDQKTFEGYVATAQKTRNRDASGLSSYQSSAKLNAADLRSQIEEHNQVIAEGMRKLQDLLQSYDAVAQNRKAVIGSRMDEEASNLNRKAIDLGQRVRERIDRYRNAVQSFFNK